MNAHPQQEIHNFIIFNGVGIYIYIYTNRDCTHIYGTQDIAGILGAHWQILIFFNTQINTCILGVLKTDERGSPFETPDF